MNTITHDEADAAINRIGAGPTDSEAWSMLASYVKQQRARDGVRPDTVTLPREVVEKVREVLSGGYMQGANGLVVDRNKVRAALAALDAANRGERRGG